MEDDKKCWCFRQQTHIVHTNIDTTGRRREKNYFLAIWAHTHTCSQVFLFKTKASLLPPPPLPTIMQKYILLLTILLKRLKILSGKMSDLHIWARPSLHIDPIVSKFHEWHNYFSYFRVHSIWKVDFVNPLVLHKIICPPIHLHRSLVLKKLLHFSLSHYIYLLAKYVMR